MKTFGYLNSHVKTIYHINVLIDIYKFHKPDLETTLVTHYLLSQYGTNKLIKLFIKRDMREVQKDLDQLHNSKLIQTRLPRELTVEQKKIALSCIMLLKEKYMDRSRVGDVQMREPGNFGYKMKIQHPQPYQYRA